MFAKFLSVRRRLMGIPAAGPVRYSEVKQDAYDYQATKARMVDALISAGCGHWIEKPVEQDQVRVMAGELASFWLA